ncbi:MAG: dTDP-4-dehydrorhamnose reductase [Hyphomonadaceae bacterium]
MAGASGQVSQSLARRAHDRGTDLVAAGRPTLDLASRSSVVAAVRFAAPDVVVNAAAYTAVDKAETDADAALQVNALGAGYLAEAAAAVDVPIIHISTDYVFDGTKSGPYLETDRPNPLCVYGVSKLEGERRVAEANARHAIVRTAWVYSPYGSNFVKTMLRLAADREEIGVVADQFGTPTYALDMADGLLDIAERVASGDADDQWGVFHFASPDDACWADLAEATFEESRLHGGPTANVRRIATEDFPTPARRPANSRLDTSKLRRVYGIQPQKWRAGLADCVRRLMEAR